MATAVLHSLLGSLLGILLAAFGWLAWQMGRTALGLDAWDFTTLPPAAGLGTLAGGAAGMASALLQPRQHASPLPSVPEKTPRQRRRHPLDRHACRARLTAKLRWHKVSLTLATLLQSSPDRLIGTPFLNRLHPEDAPAVENAFAASRQDADVHTALCRIMIPAPAGIDQPSPDSDTALLPLKDASAFLHLRIDIWAKKNRAGKVVRFDCRFVDLTPLVLPRDVQLQTTRHDLKTAREQLQTVNDDLSRLKHSYRELYQNAPVMYFSMDNEGKLVTFNDTLVHTLGYDRKELRDQNYTMLLAPATRKSYLTIAENMPKQEGELETQWRKKDGAIIDIWLHTIPVYDEAGQFVRYRSAALDMTEKNRLANELRTRGNELEGTNQRLRTINSELEAFTHVVSHDLKEPLRTLQAYSHILAEEHASELGADGFQYVNHLIRASRRLGALIDELLNLSQAGRVTRAPKIFNINQIVATVRQDLVDLIQRKEAIILTEGSLPNVIGDPVRITQLLTNLVANGLKYNKNPQPQVVIGGAPCPDAPNRTVISVRDNGIGIDPAFHSQIFGIFRRLHQGDEFEGTGAGLAICKKIVEGHGGRLWVESRLGQGATFFFTLPLPSAAKPAPTSNGAPRKAEAPSSKSRKTAIHADVNGKAPTHIVLVEDQADVGMIIQKLGKRDGLDITWFPTAEDAWDYLRTARADLLMLDVNLPGMDGVELCRRIRVLDHLKDTPVAMFTPDQEPDKLDKLRAAGADYFLTKDLLCQPAQWREKVQELLAQIRQPEPG